MIWRATRSFFDPPGFRYSSFPRRRPPRPWARRLRSTSGVPPITPIADDEIFIQSPVEAFPVRSSLSCSYVNESQSLIAGTRIEEIELGNPLVLADINRAVKPTCHRSYHIGLPRVVRSPIDVHEAKHVIRARRWVVAEYPGHILLVAADTIKLSARRAHQSVDSVLGQWLPKVRNGQPDRIET